MGFIYKSTKNGLDKFLVRPLNMNRKPAYDMLVRAEALRLAKDFKGSIKYYLSSMLIDRTNFRTFLGLGISYKAENNIEKAVKMLETARDMSCNIPEVHYELGLCYMFSKKFCEAIECFQHAIMLDKSNLNAQLQLAVAHECLEEFDMAVLIYHTIIEKHPEFLNAYNHLSALYMNIGEFKSAGIVFSQMIKVNPEFYKAYLGLAICFDKMSKTARALHYYKAFLDKKPHSHHGEKIRKRIEKLSNVRANENTSRMFAVV